MPSERIRRQIHRLLDQAESAVQRGGRVRELGESVLRLEPENADARSYLDVIR
jgi:hypothetical protein